MRWVSRDKSAILTRAPAAKLLTRAGFDPVKEIRWLGKDRSCQFHLKDNPHHLGEGSIQFAPIMRAIRDIGFSRYAILGTDAPSKQLEADMRKNLTYIRGVLA